MRVRRVVVKVGSSSVTESGGTLSKEKLQHLTNAIARIVHDAQWQVILVTSGAVAAGKGHLGWRRAQITMPEKQAAAAVGQGLLIDAYQRLFTQHGISVAQILLTRSDIEDRRRFIHIRNTMDTLLRHKILPIVNENDTVATEEIRFGDNDTLASLVALTCDAERVILLTDIDGLYTANPRSHPDAKRLDDVYALTDDIIRAAGGEGSAMGTGGMRTKVAAAKIGMQSGIDVIVAPSGQEDVLHKALRDEPVGTWFHAAPDKSNNSKRAWMVHGSRPEGTLVLDPGAVDALLYHSRSLLLPGIKAVHGDFEEHAVVDLVGQNGPVIARGACSLSAADLRLLLERRAEGTLQDVQEVVHRNHMALIAEVNNN